MSSLAGKRRASSAVSSSVSGEGHQRHNQRQRSHSSATHQQTANFGHSPASGHQQPQRVVHRGSGGGGLLNGLRNVHIFRRRSTVDNSRIRQPLMEESQAMSVTPQHQQHHPHSLNPTAAATTTNANATDVLMEMTTDINAANTATPIASTTIEEEMDDAIEGVDDVAATAAMEIGSRRLTTTSCPASKENEKCILNKMPMTTSHENFTTNTTTALVANTTTMATAPATTLTTMPSAISHLTSLPRCTSTATSAVASINGNTINNNLTQPLTLPASCNSKAFATAPTTIAFGSERNEAISIESNAVQASTTNTTTNRNNLNLLGSTLIDESH